MGSKRPQKPKESQAKNTNPITEGKKMNFKELEKLEPRLKEIKMITRILAGSQKRDWYKLIKPCFSRLVGMHRRPEHTILSSSQAYDVVYHHLHSIFAPFSHGK